MKEPVPFLCYMKYHLNIGYPASTLLTSGPVPRCALLEIKMNSSVRHIALFVPDLRAAEGYYQSVFDMELVGREAELTAGSGIRFLSTRFGMR